MSESGVRKVYPSESRFRYTGAGPGSAQVGVQELDRPAPGQRRLLRVVGAQQVLVVEERVARRIEEELRGDPRLLLDPVREPARRVRRREAVFLAEVAEHRRRQP